MLRRKKICRPESVSLASKCVFYRPEHNAKGQPHGTFESLEMQK